MEESRLHLRGFIGLVLLSTGLVATPAQAETVLSVFLGQSSTRDSDLKVDQQTTTSSATFRAIEWDDRSWQAPPYYGLRVAHYFEVAPAWGLSAEFVHYKIHAFSQQVVGVDGVWNGAPVNENAPLDQRVQNFSISHGVNYVGLSVVRRWMLDTTSAFQRGRWQPYVGAGPVLYILHPENTVNGQPVDEKYQTSGLGFQIFGGVRYGMTERWSLFLEGKYDQGRAEVEVAGGQAETDLKTRHAIIGLSYIKPIQ